MIKVGRIKDPGAVYIGRPSPLGNPFHLDDESMREQVCDQYDAWLVEHRTDHAVNAELQRLASLHQQAGSLTLGCYCAPLRCHGESVKRVLELYYNVPGDLLTYEN